MRGFLFVLTGSLLFGCENGEFAGDSGYPADGLEEASMEALMQISATDADTLIDDARLDLGLWGGQCKSWVQNETSASYGVWLAVNDTSPLSDQYKWVSDTTPATNVARWLGSYANGRTGPVSIAKGGSTTLNVTVPNADPQVIVLYASTTSVTATMTKGTTSLAVTSTGGVGGTVSASTVTGSGTWTLSVKNNGSSTATGVVAVVLSRSRFLSDWETARRGDIMQMYVGTSSANRAAGGPHTVFVQTDFNVLGTTGSTGTCQFGSTTSATYSTGCNWLDSNWVGVEIVGAHNVSMDTMMKMAAYSSLYGFTVYRLN